VDRDQAQENTHTQAAHRSHTQQPLQTHTSHHMSHAKKQDHIHIQTTDQAQTLTNERTHTQTVANTQPTHSPTSDNPHSTTSDMFSRRCSLVAGVVVPRRCVHPTRLPLMGRNQAEYPIRIPAPLPARLRHIHMNQEYVDIPCQHVELGLSCVWVCPFVLCVRWCARVVLFVCLHTNICTHIESRLRCVCVRSEFS